MSRVGKFVLQNSLSLFFLVIFIAALVGQAIAGHAAYNHDQVEHGEQAISLWSYVTSSHFGNAVMENWQSEYLQFTLFMLATVWLLQRGSPESKPIGKEGTESDRAQQIGGWAGPDAPSWARVRGTRTWVYSNSLLLVMLAIFLGSWFAQSVTGLNDYNSDQVSHHQPQLSWWSYVGNADFWEATLENWQSEFLAVGSFAVLAIYLRQRGSPESKPVGTPHDATGIDS
jgi:Domain of unknown function (DUF6766)